MVYVAKCGWFDWGGWTATCVGTDTPLHCPVLENHYILQGCDTSGILGCWIQVG